METPQWQGPTFDFDAATGERVGVVVSAVRSLAAILIRSWLRVYHRFSIVDRQNLPTDRSFVLVANHSSHLDTLCLLSSLPLSKLHCAFPAAARDYFFEGVPSRFAAKVIANALPFDRRRDIRGSLDVCRHILERPGSVLLVFPEGTRSVNGEVGEFKAGIGLLAVASRHPIVPCYLEGGHRAYPKGSWLPRPRRMRLIIGKPRTYFHLERTSAAAHQVSRDLREAVLALGPRPVSPCLQSLTRSICREELVLDSHS